MTTIHAIEWPDGTTAVVAVESNNPRVPAKITVSGPGSERVKAVNTYTKPATVHAELRYIAERDRAKLSTASDGPAASAQR